MKTHYYAIEGNKLLLFDNEEEQKRYYTELNDFIKELAEKAKSTEEVFAGIFAKRGLK